MEIVFKPSSNILNCLAPLIYSITYLPCQLLVSTVNPTLYLYHERPNRYVLLDGYIRWRCEQNPANHRWREWNWFIATTLKNLLCIRSTRIIEIGEIGLFVFGQNGTQFVLSPCFTSQILHSRFKEIENAVQMYVINTWESGPPNAQRVLEQKSEL